MTKRGIASSAVAVALLASSAAGAQPQYVAQSDSPQWLKDRQSSEGIGVRTGDLELHPGIAGEVGYDSNWFFRSNQQGVDNGPPRAPIVPALEFRVTPSLYLSTMGPQRREGDPAAAQPSVSFRLGLNATYREFIGLSSDSSQPVNDVSRQRNIGGAADGRIDIQQGRPVGGALFANYGRVIQPNVGNADPNLSFNQDQIGVGGEIVTQPGSGTLDWHFGYKFQDVLFEDSTGAVYDNATHEAYTRGRWRFRPRTALMYDATLGFTSYANPGREADLGLVNSTPVRARIGLNGLITDRFSAQLLAGWGASFYDTTAIHTIAQYDSVIGTAELKWFLSASPGIASATDVGLVLSSIALGYTRDFANSYLGGYYGTDRGYLKFNYFFAGRALVTLEGGLGAIEYPNLVWADGTARHAAFTDLRADATLFGEYRVTSTFGLNSTLRYTANFSNAVLLEREGQTLPGFGMAWNRFEAYVGARWFM
jgi:hypothetical protein